MQITCCYDDCSCSVTAIHTHANLNISGFTSTVKFELSQWARCVLKTNTTSITSNPAQTQTNVNVAPIIIIMTNSCVWSGHAAFPCPYRYLLAHHLVLEKLGWNSKNVQNGAHITRWHRWVTIQMLLGSCESVNTSQKPSLCTELNRHFHPNHSGWTPPPPPPPLPPPLLPPPAHHRQTPAAGRLPNLTPLSTHWGW